MSPRTQPPPSATDSDARQNTMRRDTVRRETVRRDTVRRDAARGDTGPGAGESVYLPVPWRRVIVVGFAATAVGKIEPLIDLVAEGAVVSLGKPTILERPGQLVDGDLLVLADQLGPRLEAIEWVRQLREQGIETPALVLTAGQVFAPPPELAALDVLPRRGTTAHALARSLGYLRQVLGDRRLVDEVGRRLRAFGASRSSDDEHRRMVELAAAYRTELEERDDDLERARARIAELEAALAGLPPGSDGGQGRRAEDPPGATDTASGGDDSTLLARRVRELETELERVEGLRQGQAAAIAELRRRLGEGSDAHLPGGVQELTARLMVSEFMRTHQLQNLQYLQQRIEHLESHFEALAALLEAPRESGELDPSNLLEKVGERLVELERSRHHQQGAIDRLSHSLAVQQVDDTFDDAQSRRNVLRRMDDAFAFARANDQPLTCLVVAIDRPDQLREEYGSVAYDFVLVQLAQRLKLTLRSHDVLLRYDSRSFVLLTEARDTRSAYHHARRLVEEVGAEEVVLGRQHMPVSISAAVTLLHPDMDSGAALMRRAQTVLDKARSWGIAQVAVDPRSVRHEKERAAAESTGS